MRSISAAIIMRCQFERLAVEGGFWKSARKLGYCNPNSPFRKGLVGDWKNYSQDAHIAEFRQLDRARLIRLDPEKDSNW
jgi:hypothetical protein